VLEGLSMTAGHGSTTIVVTRLFDAPPSAVFEAWTKTEHVAHWWDPSVSVPEHPLQVPCGVFARVDISGCCSCCASRYTIPSSRSWECGNPEGISKEWGKGGKP
jgi:Activator of Hsp90 ATPase homolog 1-like protein